MKRRIISVIAAIAMLMPIAAMPNVNAEETDTTPRIMEKLDRGLVAVEVSDGVYLSWRLLGTESLENQAFDIYRKDKKIYTTGAHDATCYLDREGEATDTYKVVRAGTTASNETAVTPWTTNVTTKSSNSSEYNSLAYMDVPIVKPEGGTARKDTKSGDTVTTETIEYSYSANDASVGDLDGDGEYEIVLKWNPSNAEDSGKWNGNYTGNVYIDAYQTDNTGKYMWRIDLGPNIRAGAHYTQFIVYDLDGDGKAEIAMKTAPGSKDGQGNYVTEAGDTDEIKAADNAIDYRDEEYGGSLGRIYQGPEYLTVFDGETGAAICTTDYIPRGNVSDWGDNGANRSERYLAGVAYLDGVHPSLVMTRGYYMKAVVYTYNFDGKKLNKVWECNGNTAGVNSLYGQGAHSLSIADIDNDGKDEIVYCSAAIDDDGTVVGNTRLGHGDALHVSDFNNDGVQEAFSVKEDAEGYTNNAADFRVPKQAPSVWGHGAGGDTGRGVMANIDDAYALENPNALSLGWSSSHPHVFGLDGEAVNPANKAADSSGYGAKPAKAAKGSFDNFLIYWDGDLGRELLDDYVIQKYYASTGSTRRFYTGNNSLTFSDIHHNNDTKRNMSLVADIFGDWREEVIAPVTDDSALRIFMSTIPTTYRLTTLMHDSQYRSAIAWQNVGYNQPPHTSYYIGSAALAKDSDTTLNYLAPAVPFTVMTYPGYEEGPAPVPPSKTTGSTIYERGTGTDTAWSSSDADAWTGSKTIQYTTDNSSNGGIYCSAAKNESYSVSKSFAFNENATVTYEIGWHLNNLIKKSYTAYLKIGSAIKIGSCHGNSSDYYTWISTDGGSTWNDFDGDGTNDNIYSKKCGGAEIAVKIVIDTSANKILSLTFAGETLEDYTSYALPDDATFDTITFGSERNASNYTYTCGLNSIKISQEVPGAEIESITASAAKTTYKEGEAFDKSTVSVTAHYSDGTDEELTPYYFSVTGYDKDTPGNQTLTVHVGDLTDTVTVNVQAKQATDITLNGTPKTAYNVGEELDLTGITVTAAYDNGTEDTIDISECTVTGYDKTKAGEQTVTVSYEGKSETFKVTVTAPRTDTYIDAGGTLAGGISAELKNYADTAILILAVYDGNTLKELQIKDAPSAVFDAVSGEYIYKIFAWQSIENMRCVCEPFDSTVQ